MRDSVCYSLIRGRLIPDESMTTVDQKVVDDVALHCKFRHGRSAKSRV